MFSVTCQLPLSPQSLPTPPLPCSFIYLLNIFHWDPISQSGVFASLQTCNLMKESLNGSGPHHDQWQLSDLTRSLGWKRSTRWSRIFLSREWHLLPWTFLESLGKRDEPISKEDWVRKERKIRSCWGLGEFQEKGERQPVIPSPDSSGLRDVIFVNRVHFSFQFSTSPSFLLNTVRLEKNNHLRT